MRSIGVLQAMRKKKCVARGFPRVRNGFVLLVLLLVCTVAGAAQTARAQEDKSLSTRNNESAISRNPVTGDRTMATPEPGPKQEYEGPQTIIVAPEVYPGRPHGGGRPPHPDRPHKR